MKTRRTTRPERMAKGDGHDELLLPHGISSSPLLIPRTLRRLEPLEDVGDPPKATARRLMEGREDARPETRIQRRQRGTKPWLQLPLKGARGRTHEPFTLSHSNPLQCQKSIDSLLNLNSHLHLEFNLRSTSSSRRNQLPRRWNDRRLSLHLFLKSWLHRRFDRSHHHSQP